MRRLAGIGAAAAALVLAGSTAASPADSLLRVRIGDQIAVGGTSLLCQAQISEVDFKGKKLVACFKLRGKSLAPGSYSPALVADGSIAVAKVGNRGRTIVFRRKPAGLGAKGRLIRAKAGDDLDIVGTDMACSVTQASRGIPYMNCFHVTAAGGKVGSYGFSISDTAVAVTRFTSLKAARLVKTYRHA